MENKLLNILKDCNNNLISADTALVQVLDLVHAPDLLNVKRRLSKIKSWIDESILERESTDDGVTDREANADMLLNKAIKLCDADF